MTNLSNFPRPGGLTYLWRGLLLALLLAGPVGSWAQAPAFTPASCLNPTAANGTSGSTGIALDAAGNQYITGFFEDTLVLGATTLVSAGKRDIFVAKRSTRTWLWAIRAGGSGRDTGHGVAVDAAGNALVTGYFSAPASFATRPTATALASVGDDDIFVARFGAADGAVAWAVRAGGSGVDESTGVVVDADSNVLATISFTADKAAFGSQTLTGRELTGYVAVMGRVGSKAPHLKVK